MICLLVEPRKNDWSCFVLAVYLDHKIDPEADPLGIGAAALILGDRQTERIQFGE